MTPPFDPTAVFDQLGASLESSAGALGQYHRSLVLSGMPEGTADRIVIDVASRMHATWFPIPNPFGDLFKGKP